MAYEVLAQVYDRFTRDVDYADIVRFVTETLGAHGIADGLVLDLACGTGSLSFMLADAGYEVVGVDSSEDMLAAAMTKAGESSAAVQPVFIKQDMRRLDLYGTVRAAVCTLDAINHLTTHDDLVAALGRVSLFVEPGGLFIFDINAPCKLQAMDGHTYVEQDDDFYCAWSVAQQRRRGMYNFYIDLFRREGRLWRREYEQFAERAYTIDEVSGALKHNGFRLCGIYDGYRFEPADNQSERIIFVTEKC